MKAIIFDLDNTLIEWLPENINALKIALKNSGYNLDNDKVEKIDYMIDEHEKNNIHLTKESLLNYINKNCNLNLEMKFIDNLIFEQGKLSYKDEDVLDTIKYLSNKYDLYVITNWFTKTQKDRLEKMGILKYFKKVIGADKNIFKPDKRAFDIILKQYSASECTSVGDSLINDIEVPISLGMDAIWKTNEYSSKYKTIKKISDLKNIL